MSKDIYRDLLSTCIAKPDISLFDDYPFGPHASSGCLQIACRRNIQVIGNGCLPISSLPALNKAPGVPTDAHPLGRSRVGQKSYLVFW